MLGLISGLKERMTEAEGAVNPNVLSVRTAERKRSRHARHHAAIHRRTIQIDYPDYTAHRSFPAYCATMRLSAELGVTESQLTHNFDAVRSPFDSALRKRSKGSLHQTSRSE